MGLLYGRAGRLTALFGGFRPGRAVVWIFQNVGTTDKYYVEFGTQSGAL